MLDPISLLSLACAALILVVLYCLERLYAQSELLKHSTSGCMMLRLDNERLRVDLDKSSVYLASCKIKLDAATDKVVMLNHKR